MIMDATRLNTKLENRNSKLPPTSEFLGILCFEFRVSKLDQTSGDLRHTERLVTVASFRTWRGSRTSVAQSPKSDMFCPYSLQLH